MNQKAKVFDKFLADEEIIAFERKDFDDEDGTVVYRSYIQSPIGNMPFFVILDTSIYALMRIVVGPAIVTDENRADINRFINRENARYKGFKYYIDEEDQSLYIDCVYMVSDDHFEAELMYALMNQLVDYIPHVVGDMKAAYHLQGRFANPMEGHQH